MSNTAGQLPLYQCHKQVRAARISVIEIDQDGSARIATYSAGEFSSNEPVIIHAAPGWASRWKGSEEDKGYYVVYDDGFASWSPTKAFEEGYTKVEAA